MYDAMMNFVRTFRFMLARSSNYYYRRGSKLWKNCIHQKHGRKAAGGGGQNAYLTSPLDPPLLISSCLNYLPHYAAADTFKWLFFKDRKTGGMDNCIIINKLSE